MTVNTTWVSAAAGGTLDLAAGTIVTETHWDALVSNLNHLGGATGKIGARAVRTTTLSVTNNLDSAITFPTEAFDTSGMFTPTGSVITIQLEGTYLLTGWCLFASNASGRRVLTLSINSGNNPRLELPPVSGSQTGLLVTAVVDMTVGGTVSLVAFQTSGGALNIEEAQLAAMKL
jgi:hypothetical protein